MSIVELVKKVMHKTLDITTHTGNIEVANNQDNGQNPTVSSILDVYVKSSPSHEAAFNIFEGKWSSAIPGFGIGSVPLFQDPRIDWIEKQCRTLQGKNILELGPLEGGHTYMLSKAGAASIKSIESNTTAFLKCLIVQNALKFDAEFLLGDFSAYLDICTDKFDLILASGVLYHMTNPVKLLQDMAKVTKAIGIWTQYYDASVILNKEALKRKFEAIPEVQQVNGREVVMYKQSYLESLNWGGFCGGSAPTSYWLTLESIIGVLEDLGFKIEIGNDDKDHPNGPAILLFASK